MTNSWPTWALEDLASVERGKFSARPRNDPKYYGGDIPFIQTGDVANAAGCVRRYAQTLNAAGLSVSRLFPKGSLVVTIAANVGDVARVDFDFACPDSLVVVQANEGVDRGWLQYSLESKKELLDSRAPRNAQKNINLETLRPLTFDVPPLGEQQRIAGALATWDAAIRKTEQLIAANERHYAGLVRRLITDRSRSAGWRLVRIRDIADRVQRQADGGDYPLLTISSASGFIRQEERYSRYMAGESAKTYTLLRAGEYSYNKGNSKRYEFGCVVQLQTYDAALVPHVYVSFRLRDSVCAAYMRHLFAADYLKPQLRALVKTGVRNNGLLNIRPEEFMGATVPLPSLEEQTRIANALGAVTDVAERLRQQLVRVRAQKRGLMQKLLTGHWRLPLIPESTA